MKLNAYIHDLLTVHKVRKSIKIQKEENAIQYDLTKLRLRPMGDMQGEQLCVFIQVFNKFQKGIYLGFVRNNEYVYGCNYVGTLDEDVYSSLHYQITYIGGTVQRYGALIRRNDNHKPLYEEEWINSHPGIDINTNDEYDATIRGIVEDYYEQLKNPIPYKIVTADRLQADLFSCVNLVDDDLVIDKDIFREIIEQVKIDNINLNHKSSVYKHLLKEVKQFMEDDFNKKEIKETLEYLK